MFGIIVLLEQQPKCYQTVKKEKKIIISKLLKMNQLLKYLWPFFLQEVIYPELLLNTSYWH